MRTIVECGQFNDRWKPDNRCSARDGFLLLRIKAMNVKPPNIEVTVNYFALLELCDFVIGIAQPKSTQATVAWCLRREAIDAMHRQET